MSEGDRNRLREIQTFPALVKYLREELRWPVEQDNFDDIDDLTFDWDAEELGIDPKQAAKIEYVKQLRPLDNGQPQGVFFVKFDSRHLPVVAMRKLLQTLVVKKRASAKGADRPMWEMRNLVFISSYGESAERQLSFAYFQEPESQDERPALKVLGWDDTDTPLHLDKVHDLLQSHLTWPKTSKELPAWRAGWSAAFQVGHGETVRTAKDLAEKLATLARRIREQAKQLLQIETKTGPLRSLMTAFKKALIHDLTDEQFADMYAQTVAYGLLSARITHPDPLKAETLPDLIPVTNPFLKELMETFVAAGGKPRGPKRAHHIDFDELGINDVVELLRRANMDAVLRNFGAGDRKEDPVTYFYEDFLNAYDAQERKRRGVYYTPKPVVSYIVRSVHDLLQTEFAIDDGLASTITWGEMSKRHKDLKIPKGIVLGSPFVQILDPATGTATFLVEVIDVVRTVLKARWKKEGLSEAKQADAWNEYVPKHLLPRLYGYELMMAPYAIAHLKIGLKLFETGYRFGSDERARIYLTNALDPASDASYSQIDALSEALAHEAAAVNDVKRTRRFTVVIGNPPYSGVSSNRNEWIEALLTGDSDVTGSATSYYKMDGRPLGEKKLWLQDDYVKFIRFSHFLLERSSLGVLGMITNHSFVDSPTCRGLRFQLRQFFSNIDIVDLHGSTKKGEVPPDDGLIDENVFDILPGVAIAVCSAAPEGVFDGVRSYDLWGPRQAKVAWLVSHSPSNVDWKRLTPTSPYYLFVQRQLDFQSEYHAYISLRDVFPFFGTGIQTSRDGFAVAFERRDLEARLRQFFDLSASDREVASLFALTDTRGWKLANIRRASSFEKVSKSITEFIFRTFDRRWVALSKDIVDWPRLEVMGSVGPQRLGLLCSRQQATRGFRHALVVDAPVDMFCMSNQSREGQTLFPLFRNPSGGLFSGGTAAAQRELNVGEIFASALRRVTEGGASAGKASLLDESAARQGFAYIYAILYSPSYRQRYADLLKMDYPRVPMAARGACFRDLVGLGEELVSFHLFESPKVDTPITTYTGRRSPAVDRVGWSHDTVWLDTSATKKGESAKPGTVGFKGVPEDVWTFHLGGYQICEKWLKDRKGRTLSKGDIEHYQKIVLVVAETIRIMKEIDEVIEKHGGWPGAFQTEASDAPEEQPLLKVAEPPAPYSTRE